MKKKRVIFGGVGVLAAALVIVLLVAFTGSGAKLAGIAFTEDSIELLAGDSVAVALTYEWDKELDADKQAEAKASLEVAYTSSDEAVAVVSADGEVTALAEGETQIQAITDEYTATCTVSVQPVLEGIETATRIITLEVDEKATIDEIKPIPANAEMGEVEYKSSNEKAATVDDSGEVTAIAEGRATITISCGEHTTKVTVIVTEPEPEEEEPEDEEEENDTTGSNTTSTTNSPVAPATDNNNDGNNGNDNNSGSNNDSPNTPAPGVPQPDQPSNPQPTPDPAPQPDPTPDNGNNNGGWVPPDDGTHDSGTGDEGWNDDGHIDGEDDVDLT